MASLSSSSLRSSSKSLVIVVTKILGILCLSAVVSYASFGGGGHNATTADTESNHDAPIPFPGITWLDRMADRWNRRENNHDDDDNSNRNRNNNNQDVPFVVGGIAYTSPYGALLEDVPLERPCRNFNAYINSILFPSSMVAYVIRRTGDNINFAHYLICYLRNLIGAMIVYYGTASIFHYFCYVHPQAKRTFEGQNRIRPTKAVMWDQIRLAQSSLFLYVGLPVVDEWLIENQYTRVYFTIHEIGGSGPYLASMMVYFSLVEIGIYWMHRTLHTNKWMYKNIHLLHHKYNKPEMLTPWASIAFHPADGLLQACPYTLCLPLVPCHYLTHFILLFFTAIWATYIHDAMDWNVDPIMGAKYHTVHHTHYIYNYGQIFTFCDQIWGTYKIPDGPTGVERVKGVARQLSATSRMGGGNNKPLKQS